MNIQMIRVLHPFWQWSTFMFQKLLLYTFSFWNHVDHTKVGMELLQQSIKPNCKTNLPSLLQSTFPICIYLPYLHLPSLLAYNHHTNLLTPMSQQSIKPSFKTNLPSLLQSTFPICIYLPYLHLPSLLAYNIPSCILSQHNTHTHKCTHTHVHKLIMTDPDPADPDVLEWLFSFYFRILLRWAFVVYEPHLRWYHDTII